MTTTLPKPSVRTGADWRLGPLFALRVAGLPIDVVAGLRNPDARRDAEEMLEIEAELAEQGVALSDLLHGLIGANDDEASRRGLLALRRQVFKNALPADPAAALAVVGAVDQSALPVLSRWIERRTRLDGLRRDIAGVLADDVARSREALGALVSEPRLRGGLQVASAVLDQQLASASQNGSTPPAKKIRKIERSLLSYLYRTACKTSPFSSFTGVGLGEFVEGDEVGLNGVGFDDFGIVLDEGWRSHVRLNVVVLGRLNDLITADLERRGDLPLTLSAGWRQDEDRVRYVRRWVTIGDDSASVSFDSVKDGLFFLRRSGVLDKLTALFAGTAGLRCRDVVAWLGAETGAPEEDCEEYLSTLLRLGMLQLNGFATDVHAADPLRGLQNALRGVGRPWADGYAVLLDEPIGIIDAYPTAGLDRRRRLGADLRRSLHEIQCRLGDENATLPQTLIFEDVRATDAPVRTPAHAWRERFGPHIAALERVLPLFDATLPHRITLAGFFQARFGRGGRCDDLLKLVEDFHDDLYEQYSSFTAGKRPWAEDGTYTPEENWLGRPEIRAIDDARQSLAVYLRSIYSAAAPEVRLDDGVIAGIGDLVAPALRGFQPQGYFAQLADRPDGALLVINQAFGGLSFPFSRFTHCFDGDTPSLSDRLRAHSAVIAPEGAVFAEVTGGTATTNLNLHGQLTDYVIVCPGETSAVPASEQLTLDDLYVVHDEATDRMMLRSTRLGREVIPLYLGYLMPMALPQISRTLLLLSPAAMARLEVWNGVPKGPEPGGVSTRPRVRLGDVVLSRRSWSVVASDAPLRAAGDTDADWFVGWQRWRRAHDLPRQVFVTVYPAKQGTKVANPKPQYLDFDSYLSLLAFEAAGHDPADRFVLREMLPAADELSVHSTRGDHVAEFAIETYSSAKEIHDDLA